MVRLRLDVDYDGTRFHGWAAQPGQRTVEGELSSAIGVALRVASVALVVAGRTDAGVHAHGQVCHVDVASWDTPSPDDLSRLQRRLRGLLPGDVRVSRVSIAPLGFDARFSAIRRHYRYLLCDDPAGVPALRRDTVAFHPRPLSVAAMAEASQSLLGLADFAAFCKRRDVPAGMASTVRTLLRFDWERDVDGMVAATLSADAFCHSMVRALVGCLVVVGDGRRPAEWPRSVLELGRRDPAVTVAAAHGLALLGVDYADDAQLAERAREARAVRGLTPPVG